MPQLILRLGAKFKEQTAKLRASSPDLCELVVRAARSLTTTAGSPLDTLAIMLPDAREFFTRRVQRKNVWIWYRIVDMEVVVVRLSTSPPMPTLPGGESA